MSHTPRTRTVVGCTLLVIALGAGVTGCGSDGNPLSAKPYDAADQISFNGPTGDGRKADPDKPLEVTAEDADGRITDVTAMDAAGRYVGGRTLRRRHPLAQHLPAGRQRPLHGPGEHRGRGRRPRPQGPHLRHQQAAQQEAPEGHLRPQGGHVRRGPARHGRAEPARQGQGASGPSSSAPSRSTRPPPSRAAGTGWTTRNSTTAPRSTGPPTPPSRSAATWTASRSATGSGAARSSP